MVLPQRGGVWQLGRMHARQDGQGQRNAPPWDDLLRGEWDVPGPGAAAGVVGGQARQQRPGDSWRVYQPQ